MSRDSDFAVTVEEWRKVEEQMQAGHGLRDSGKPFVLADDAATRAPGRVGCGLCACGAASSRLPSDVGRRRWYRQHLDDLGIGPAAVTRAVMEARTKPARNDRISPAKH